MKNQYTLVLLAILLGSFGVHRFYVGKIASGIFMLLTFGGFGIWWLIDIIFILTGEFKDAKGNKIKSEGFSFAKIIKPAGVFLIIFSCIMLIPAFATYLNARSFKSNAILTEGIITGLRETVSEGNTYYYPIFEFVDSSGEKHTIHSSTGSNPPNHSEGDKIEVLYMKDSPEKAKLNSFSSIWLMPLLLSILSIGNLLLGSMITIIGHFIQKPKVEQVAGSNVIR